MYNRTTASGLLLFPALLALASGCASHPLSKEQANYPTDQVNARGLFEENCATCHGKNGRVHTFHGRLLGAQNFTEAQWQADTTDAEIINAIKTGPATMPAFGKKLSSTEIEALAKYVRTFKNEP